MKKFATTLEFEGSFPAKPSDGTLLAYTQKVGQSIGSQLAKSGWRHGAVKVEATPTQNKYKLLIPLRRQSAREFQESIANQQVDQITTALLPRLPGWRRVNTPMDVELGEETSPEMSVQELLAFPDDWENNFSHIYDRDVQIREMMAAIRIARDSDMRVRNHVLFHGPPGGGKSEILMALSNMFGDIAVKRLDATSTTKAGAINYLLQMNPIPPIIAIEEIEKVVTDAELAYLLAILDNRAEIIKTNARVGSVAREVKTIVVATVNNMEKLKSFHESALADRFGVPIYCPLPTEDLIKRVLERDLEFIPGARPEWIEPAMEYARKVEKTYQLRRIKAIMAIGGDRLLDGSFQREHEALLRQEHDDIEKASEYMTA